MEALSLTVCSDTAEANTDVSTFVHPFHSSSKNSYAAHPVSHRGHLFLGPSASHQEDALFPPPCFFFAATIRKFTCYSNSPL